MENKKVIVIDSGNPVAEKIIKQLEDEGIKIKAFKNVGDTEMRQKAQDIICEITAPAINIFAGLSKTFWKRKKA